MAIVLDASVALAAVLPDEESAFCEAAVAVGLKEGMIAPALWPYEVQNGLLVSLRRRRIDAESLAQVLETLRALSPILLGTEGLGVELRLAQEHGLSPYDAAYLATALASSSELATTDQKLQTAAMAAGVKLFTPSPRTRRRGKV